jgi:hypothetical protein
MADETTRVDVWLQGVLAGNSTLTALVGAGTPRIHADRVPQGEPFPAVVHQLQGVVDVRTATSAARIMISGVWLVKGIVKAETYQGTLRSIADAIDALLEESPGGAADTDGVVFASVREAPFRLAELDEGVEYRHLGGLYRIVAQVP